MCESKACLNLTVIRQNQCSRSVQNRIWEKDKFVLKESTRLLFGQEKMRHSGQCSELHCIWQYSGSFGPFIFHHSLSCHYIYAFQSSYQIFDECFQQPNFYRLLHYFYVIVKIQNIYIMLLCTHLYHSKPIK